MTNRFRSTLVVVLALVSQAALAQDASQPPTPAPEAPPPPVSIETSPPAAADAPPPVNIAAPVAPGASPEGQWVFTQQYGWVWMPYGESYANAPLVANGDPYLFMYYPNYGWRWLAAPWVFGIGVAPYWGTWGWHHYGWYGHGWWGHSWWGYRHGWPAGYHGVVATHPAWAARGQAVYHNGARPAAVYHNGAGGHPVAHPAAVVHAAHVAHTAHVTHVSHPHVTHAHGGGHGHHR